MHTYRSYLMFVLALVILALAATPGTAQQYKMTTPIAPGVATPDKLDTSVGTLHLSDGNPDADTVKKIYDNLDQSRALQAEYGFLLRIGKARLFQSPAESSSHGVCYSQK